MQIKINSYKDTKIIDPIINQQLQEAVQQNVALEHENEMKELNNDLYKTKRNTLHDYRKRNISLRNRHNELVEIAKHNNKETIDKETKEIIKDNTDINVHNKILEDKNDIIDTMKQSLQNNKKKNIDLQNKQVELKTINENNKNSKIDKELSDVINKNAETEQRINRLQRINKLQNKVIDNNIEFMNENAKYMYEQSPDGLQSLKMVIDLEGQAAIGDQKKEEMNKFKAAYNKARNSTISYEVSSRVKDANNASTVTQANYLLSKTSEVLDNVTDFNVKNTLFDQNIDSKLRDLADLNSVAFNKYNKETNFIDNFFNKYPTYAKYLNKTDRENMSIDDKTSMDNDLRKFIKDTQFQLENPHLF